MTSKILYTLMIAVLLISCDHNHSTTALNNKVDSAYINADSTSEDLQELMLGVTYCFAHPNDPKHGINKNGNKDAFKDIEKTKGYIYVDPDHNKRYTKGTLPKEGFVVVYKDGEYCICGCIENMEFE